MMLETCAVLLNDMGTSRSCLCCYTTQTVTKPLYSGDVDEIHEFTFPNLHFLCLTLYYWALSSQNFENLSRDQAQV